MEQRPEEEEEPQLIIDDDGIRIGRTMAETIRDDLIDLDTRGVTGVSNMLLSGLAHDLDRALLGEEDDEQVRYVTVELDNAYALIDYFQAQDPDGTHAQFVDQLSGVITPFTDGSQGGLSSDTAV